MFLTYFLVLVSAFADRPIEETKANPPLKITTTQGRTVSDNQNSLTAGERGPILLQDFPLIDKIAHFDRERIPERVVHAKGTGVHGYFEVTHDITKYCKAKMFSSIGKRTPVFARFSTVEGSAGSADTVRDPRGFALKFYTEEGNWDMVGNNTPIFFIRDTIKFPDFVHALKPSPDEGLGDPNRAWDFISLSPETVHQVTILFSERGLPDGFRHMDGFSSHTYKMVNEEGENFFIKIHFKTRQGIKNLSNEEAARLAAEDPNYSRRDLFRAIDRKEYPSWDMFIQVLTPEEADRFPYDVLDVTKVWPHKLAPLIPVGRMVLNAKPENFFAEVEQVAFSPSHMIPGIEPSNDKLLQGRLFSYPDTHRHRLGKNSHQIPINCPYRSIINNDAGYAQGLDYVVRDGPMTTDDNNGALPNYEPNTQGPHYENFYKETPEARDPEYLSGVVGRFPYNHPNSDFEQPGILYRRVMNDRERDSLIENIVGSLSGARQDIQERMIEIFTKCDEEYGYRVAEGLRSRRLL